MKDIIITFLAMVGFAVVTLLTYAFVILIITTPIWFIFGIIYLLKM